VASQVKYNGGFWKAIADFLLVVYSNICFNMQRFQVIRDFSNFFIKPEVTKRRFHRQVSSQVKGNGGFWKAIANLLLEVYCNNCSTMHRFPVISDFMDFFH
jgi:hypothetical protein